MTYKVEIEISSEKIANQIITAMEGGSGYWCSDFKLISSENKPVERPWYADQKLYEGDFVIHAHTNEDSMQKTYVITPYTINAGLKAMSGSKHARALAEIVNDEGDADTADIFLQFVLFGELVFG